MERGPVRPERRQHVVENVRRMRRSPFPSLLRGFLDHMGQDYEGNGKNWKSAEHPSSGTLTCGSNKRPDSLRLHAQNVSGSALIPRISNLSLGRPTKMKFPPLQGYFTA